LKSSIGDKIIYNVKTPNGWSIIIMPDNILIDNYHIDTAHIHPDPENHVKKIKLSEQDPDKIFEAIKEYLQVSDRFDVSELMEMLR
jgi:hypothetical protein